MLLLALGCRPLPTGDTGAAETGPSTSPDTDTSEPAEEGTPLRIATWNIESLGSSGTDQYEATRDILARIDADVVGLNELDAHEESRLQDLADALGYDTVVFPDDNPFGDLRNAMLARETVTDLRVIDSEDLSGDRNADDLTRLPIMLTVRKGGVDVTIIGQHFKSGFYTEDEFRRAVDGQRTAQSVAEALGTHVVVMGDLNEELGEAPSGSFTSMPSDVPSSYHLGNDLWNALFDTGIPKDPFTPLVEAGLTPLDAAQLDGREATRDASGRRIDYILVNDAAAASSPVTEVYDSRDEGSDGLPKAGEAPAREASEQAADHFPVIVELTVK